MAATLQTSVIQATGSTTPNLTLDASGNATVGNTLVMGSSFKRNRIINGDMRVDQRRAGGALTPATNGDFLVDRFVFSGTQASKFFGGQNYNSVTPPAGFTSYAGLQCSTAYAVTASDFFGVIHRIEGLNTADLAWGTSSAKPVTLSFQVYSSLTGTFGGSLQNSASNRSYPFSYSIPVANTWTTINITIAGDTTGTWLATNGIGIQVFLGIGVGSTYSGAAGSWAATSYLSCTGATSVVGTAFATFYITGVQLEVGSVATPYERQIYSDQLQQCCRYYWNMSPTSSDWVTTIDSSAVYRRCAIPLPVRMRATPSCSVTGTYGGATSGFASTYPLIDSVSTDRVNVALDIVGTSGIARITSFTASAEL